MLAEHPELVLWTIALLPLLLSRCTSAGGVVSPHLPLPATVVPAFARRPVSAFPTPTALPDLPSAWQVSSSALADVTDDGVAEWVLLVWRPWRDWPIQRWSAAPSPVAGFHDSAGQSCQLVLLDPRDGRETWAGSALPVPLLALAVEDVDRDGKNEVLAIEGSYAHGRDGPGTRVDAWRWNGFGFTLEWRSPPGVFDPACLADADRCGLLDIAIR